MKPSLCLLIMQCIILYGLASPPTQDHYVASQRNQIEIVAKFFAYAPSDSPPLTGGKGAIPFGLYRPPQPVDFYARDLNADHSSKNGTASDINSTGFNAASSSYFQSKLIINRVNSQMVVKEHFPDMTRYNIISLTEFTEEVIPQIVKKQGIGCCRGPLDSCHNVGELFVPQTVKTFRSVPLTVLSTESFTYTVPKTDAYISFISFCDVSDVNISVITSLFKTDLFNYYGYLPGTEAPKATLYAYLAILSICLIAGWLVLLIRYRSQIISIHIIMCFVLILALFESVSWLMFYRTWNAFNTRDPNLLIGAIIISVVKNVVSLMLILAASSGLGITVPKLDPIIVQKILLFALLLFVFDTVRQIATQSRFSSRIYFLVLFASILLVSMLYVTIFSWIFAALNERVEELQTQNQRVKLLLFTKFWFILVLTITITCLLVLCQTISLVFSSAKNWRHEWIPLDLLPAMGFMVILITMLFLWAPSKNSKLMAYSSELVHIQPHQPSDTHTSLYGLPTAKVSHYAAKLSEMNTLQPNSPVRWQNSGTGDNVNKPGHYKPDQSIIVDDPESNQSEWPTSYQNL